MDFTTLLAFLGLIGTVWNNPIPSTSWTCPEKSCTPTEHNILHQLPFKHESDLKNISAAPWTLEDDDEDGREPRFIEKVKCNKCIVPGMVARTIYIQIPVYRMVTVDSHIRWCKCSYKLAVGCTCVKS